MTVPFVLVTEDARLALQAQAPGSMQTCITSPPYWRLRDYGHLRQIGLEPEVNEYIQKLVDVFRGVRRLLHDDGTLWVVIGDTYAHNGHGSTGSRSALSNPARQARVQMSTIRGSGCKRGDLVGVPWRLAFALRDDGWFLRAEVIWSKVAPKPESVTNRPTRSHEQVFLFSASENYYYDAAAIAEPCVTPPHVIAAANKQIRERGRKGTKGAGLGKASFVSTPTTRNKRSVWSPPPEPFRGEHSATYPEGLVRPMILASSRPGDVVLDPFCGSGRTGTAALRAGRRFVGVDVGTSAIAEARAELLATIAELGQLSPEQAKDVTGAAQLGLLLSTANYA